METYRLHPTPERGTARPRPLSLAASRGLWQPASVRVLVTGASGFVGARLRPALERAGHAVLAPDVDVVDGPGLAAVLERLQPEAVVHLAALSFVPEAEAHPEAAYRVNFRGARNLLEAVRSGAPAARVLLVGSGASYGAAPAGSAAFAEEAPLRPGDAYARTKAAADLLGAVYARRGLDVLRVRPFNHTGPGRPDAFVESSFARQLAEIEAGRRPPRLDVGNLDAVRDFLPVEDVVEAYLRLLDPAVPAQAYNVASGRGTTIREILELLLARSAARPEIRVDRARWRPTDASVGSPARLERLTGWAPRVPLAEALGALLEAWRREVRAA